MLAPNQRQHLLEALRPPAGYELSFAIGTTYSLDLMALLCIPLAFAQFDWEDNAGKPAADPLALLEALSRYSDRLHVFCQAGCISVPSKGQLLFGYLEKSVFQAQAAFGGVFHPKVWALRFTSPDSPVMYRLLCLSRNLTFDQSWDTLLCIEGEVVDRQRAYAAHHPLGDFIQALPGLALETLPEHVLANISLAGQELRRTSFYLPEGFKEYGFWPMGIPGYQNQWPFKGSFDRLLAVSPFISPTCLHRLAAQSAASVLMSRLDSLSALPRQDLAGFKKIFALNPMAETEEPACESPETQFFEAPASGLHAKLYVADDGRNAHVWAGSANATTAAFNQNVEFLIELVGAKSFCGVDVFLEATQGQSRFADLWQPFNPTNEVVQLDPIQRQLENALRAAQTTLVSAGWHGQVHSSSPNDYLMQISPAQEFKLASEITMLYWPLSLSPVSAFRYDEKNTLSATFGPLAVESLTAFVVFQLNARIGGKSLLSQFVLQVPLEGVPEDRPERLLRAMLKNRNQVMRFLLFILADGKNDVDGAGIALLDALNSERGDFQNRNPTESPLFEALVQALAREPSRLDQIARTVTDLEQTSEGAQLLPPGFHTIWAPIWEARQRLRS
jgi:hypothetical protein